MKDPAMMLIATCTTSQPVISLARQDMVALLAATEDPHAGSSSFTRNSWIRGRTLGPLGTSFGQEKMILRGHKGPVWCVAVSACGIAASGGTDGSVLLWDGINGCINHELKGHAGTITAVAFSPDSKILCSTSLDKTIRWWNVATGSEIYAFHITDLGRLSMKSVMLFEVRRCLLGGNKGHMDGAWCVAFSKDGQRVAAGCSDGNVRIFNCELMSDISHVNTLVCHDMAVLSVDFDSSNQHVLTASHDHTAKLYNISGGESTFTVNASNNAISRACFSHSSSRFATVALWDDIARVWTINGSDVSLDLLLLGHGHGGIIDVCWSSDDTLLLTSGIDQSFRVWDSKTGHIKHVIVDTGFLSQQVPTVSARVCFYGSTSLISSSTAGVVKIWDLDCQETNAKADGGIINLTTAMAHHPSALSPIAAAGSAVGEICLWDSETGAVVGSVKAHAGWVWSLSFSPDGSKLVSTSQDRCVCVWDINTLKSILAIDLSVVNTLSRSAKLSDDGLLVVSCLDFSVRVFNVNKGLSSEIVLSQHLSKVLSTVIYPNGQCFATGCKDGNVLLWNMAVDSPLTSSALLTCEGPVSGLAVSADGCMLAAAMSTPSLVVILSDAHTGEQKQILKSMVLAGKDEFLCYASVTFSGQHVIAGACQGSKVMVWHSSTGQTVRTLKGCQNGNHAVCASGDGKTVIVAGSDGNIRVLNVSQGMEIRKLSYRYSTVITCVAFHPSGQWVASGGMGGCVRVWNVNGDCARSTALSGHRDMVWSVAYNSTGKLLASGSQDCTVRVWRMDDSISSSSCDDGDGDGAAHCIFTYTGHESWVMSVAFINDNRHIASGSLDTSTQIWDYTTGTSLIVLKPSVLAMDLNIATVKSIGAGMLAKLVDSSLSITPKSVNAIACSRDGMLVASGYQNGTVRVWSVEKGSVVQKINAHSGKIYFLGFDVACTKLATASTDGTMKVWNHLTGCEVLSIEHPGIVYSVCYSNDGECLLTTCEDGCIRVWGAMEGELQAVLRGHSACVTSAVFVDDGRYVASSSFDGTVRVWSIGNSQLANNGTEY
jgi:WD40 repeat protein